MGNVNFYMIFFKQKKKNIFFLTSKVLYLSELVESKWIIGKEWMYVYSFVQNIIHIFTECGDNIFKNRIFIYSF